MNERNLRAGAETRTPSPQEVAQTEKEDQESRTRSNREMADGKEGGRLRPDRPADGKEDGRLRPERPAAERRHIAEQARPLPAVLERNQIGTRIVEAEAEDGVEDARDEAEAVEEDDTTSGQAREEEEISCPQRHREVLR